MYTREMIEELNALSKEVLGSSSKWRKIIDRGRLVPVTVEAIETKTVEGKEVQETVTKHAVYHNSKTPMYQIQRETPESIKEHLLKLKEQQEAFRKMIQQAQEEARQKEEEKKQAIKTIEENSGSAK